MLSWLLVAGWWFVTKSFIFYFSPVLATLLEGSHDPLLGRDPQIIIIIIIIMNISPRKLIQEPQMRSCSSHLSNRNVLSNFRNESKLKDGSFILAGRSFQIVGPQTLNDLGPNVTALVLGMYSCPEVADRNYLWPGIAETTMHSADKKVPVHSNISTSEWRSWKLPFVALATNKGCATLAWCDRISEYQWWTVLPCSGTLQTSQEFPADAVQ